MKKILVPTDFSDRTEAAMIHAASIALKFDVPVLLIHFFGSPWEKSNLIINITDVIAANAQQSMNDTLRIYKSKFPNLKLEGLCIEGNMISGINKAVLENDVNLVVMGIESDKLSNVFSGKHTSLLLSQVIAPVLIVTNVKNAHHPHNILMVSEHSKNTKEIDVSISMLENVFSDPDPVYYTALEKDDFVINNTVKSQSSIQKNDAQDNEQTATIEDKSMDLLVLVGKKRKTWSRFLKSQTGLSMAQHFNAHILIWAGQ